ncbi:unnamed protein product [Protopolystoma xenopodis]|uniref:Uncharacterized protein n=1 Tax=Protopolystoma xenopodis TaxID=117903 RepID=A0A3S4ZP57_9PLAT|nr:unnamed protein product [Protopolystoma xenopodis]
MHDPTCDLADVERYRLAFMMQFFVQQKQRFRFPRLRLQDLYQRVITNEDTTPLCDIIARILRFFRHGDPSVRIDTVEPALAQFVGEKRTPSRVAMQRLLMRASPRLALASTGGGGGGADNPGSKMRPLSDLPIPERAQLLDSLIECVYDEQPDLPLSSGFNNSNTGNAGSAAGTSKAVNDTGSSGRQMNGSSTPWSRPKAKKFRKMGGIEKTAECDDDEGYNDEEDETRDHNGSGADAADDLNGEDDDDVSDEFETGQEAVEATGTATTNLLDHEEDVNVLIKAGQDAQGCSYYYMDG